MTPLTTREMRSEMLDEMRFDDTMEMTSDGHVLSRHAFRVEGGSRDCPLLVVVRACRVTPVKQV